MLSQTVEQCTAFLKAQRLNTKSSTCVCVFALNGFLCFLSLSLCLCLSLSLSVSLSLSLSVTASLDL